METKLDALHSTESNKICSLLSTDLRDSTTITKEKEEELLNEGTSACEEDIDEDEALSDDSLRLKLSDDDETEQDDVDSSEFYCKRLKEEESDEDSKYRAHEEKFATTSEEEKDTFEQHQENFESEEEDYVDQKASKFESEENFEVDQTNLIDTDELNLSEDINSIEGAHDQDKIMNGNDPRFYPNAYDSRWAPTNHRARFVNRPPPPRSYYQNANYNAPESDPNNSRYYNNYKHYNNKTKSPYQNYNFKPKDKNKAVISPSSNLTQIKCKSKSTSAKGKNDGDKKVKQEKKEKRDSSEGKLKETELVTQDKKIEKIDSKVDKINSASKEVLNSESSENEKENLNDCITDSMESFTGKTAETTEVDLPNTLTTDTEEKAVVRPVKESSSPNTANKETSNTVISENTTESVHKNIKKESTNSVQTSEDSNDKTAKPATEGVMDDCRNSNSKNNGTLKESNDQSPQASVQNDRVDSRKLEPNGVENCKDNLEDMDFGLVGEEGVKKEEDETMEEEETSQKPGVKNANELNTVLPLSSTMNINEDSGSAMNNLPKVYQCLEEIASMEASRKAQEMEKSEETVQEDLVDNSRLKLQVSERDNNNDNACENNHDVNEKNKNDIASVSAEKSPAIEEDSSLQYSAISNEGEALKDSQLLDGDDNACDNDNRNNDNHDDNMEEGENSNLSLDSSDTVIFSSKSDTDEKEKCLQEVDKMNFDDNACHSNEDAKEATGNHKKSIINEVHETLIVQSTGVNMEHSRNNKFNEISNDVSNDISNDISDDTVNNDASTDGILKMSEDESNSQTSISTEKKQVEDIKLEENEEETEEETEETVDEEETAKANSKKDTEVVQEEKMIIDDNNKQSFLKVARLELENKKSKDESSKVSDLDSSSNEKFAFSTSLNISEENSSNDKKEENCPQSKQQSDATLFGPKVSPTESKDGTKSGRQKRKTARSAEDTKNKYLKSDSDGESDDSEKYVIMNYKKTKLLVDAPPSVSPTSLKRNLGEENENEIDSLESKVNVKKLKMSLESPKKLSNESYSFVKDEDAKDKKILESIRNLTSVRKFFQRDIKGQLRKLKQEELEELLIQKIVETITMNSEIGKLREQARLSEKNQEATRARCQQLAKQIQDFEMVLKRNAVDRSSSNDKFIAPIKINRSVGLQVNFISDHGMQNMRQIQQNTKSATLSNTVVTTGTNNEVSASQPRKGIKVRSPRRIENVPTGSSTPSTPSTSSTPSIPTTPSTPATNTVVQSQIPTSTVVNSVTPAALVTAKPVVAEQPTRNLPIGIQTINAQQPVISSVNIRSPSKISAMQAVQQTQQTVILNGNLTSNRIPTANALNAQKAAQKSNNDLIDLTDEEEKTKTAVSTPMTVTSATIIANHPQNQRNVIQSGSTQHYQRVIQAIPTSVALSGQTTNIRVVQPNSQSTPTALVNNINTSRLTYVMQSGGQPRQILIANPNSIRQNCTTSTNRGQFSAIAYKTANGIPNSANGTLRLVTTQAAVSAQINKHPAPLPDSGPCDTNPNWKLPPPAPSLKISKVSSGIVLSWNMTLSDKHAEIVSYQLFAYQEVGGTPPSTLLWKKVGDVMALPLPMACTLTQFSAGNNYYFAVRAVDTHSRLGQYSLPGNISL